MKSAYFWVILIVIIGGGITLYLLPSEEEIAFIHLKSEQYSKAESFYLDQYNKGVRSPSIVYELSVLLEKKGDLDGAIKIINEYAENHPDDPNAYKLLAELYYLNNHFESYAQTLIKMHAQKIALEPHALCVLKDYYHHQRDVEKHELILNQIINSGHGQEDDYSELAGVYAVKKEFDKAAEILIARRKYFQEKETTDMILFELWVNSHLDKEKSSGILEVVAAHLKKKNDPQLTFYVLNLFRDQYSKLAISFLNLIDPLINDNPHLETAALLILWDHPDQRDVVQQKIVKLETLATDNPVLKNLLFDIYLERENDNDLLRLIQHTDSKHLEERKIIDLATLETIKNNPLLSKEIQKILGEEHLKNHPLQALALEVCTRQSNAHCDAHLKFQQFLETHSLTRMDTFYLFRLAVAAKYQQEALDLGQRLPPYIGMQEEDLLEVTKSYIQMKKAALLYPSIEAALPIIGSSGQSAQALLNIALHKPQMAEEWIKSQPKIKKTTLNIFLQVSMDYEEYPLALLIAEILLEKYPSFTSESSYALVLVKMGKVEEGMALLKPIYIEKSLNPQIQREYFSALLTAIKEDRHRYADDLVFYMNAREEGDDIPQDLLRHFGYIYLETLNNFYRAQTIFFKLANESPQNRRDLKTLIYLWGPYVSLQKAEWIKTHAERATTDEELAFWLESLNFIGWYQTTIEIFQQSIAEGHSIRTSFAYMEALAYEKRNEDLKNTIDTIFDRRMDRKQLESLATYAELAEYNRARVAILQQLASNFSTDPLSWQALGKALYDIRNYCAGFKALEMFFFLNPECNNPKLYESIFELAEMYRKQRKFLQSDYCYRSALTHIFAAKEQTPHMLEVAAQCYYQLDMKYQGLYMMEKFYKISGKDSDSLAAYANMLMDNGELNRAEKLLKNAFNSARMSSARE